MFEKFEKKVIKMNEELDSVDYLSAELQEQFYQLENDLEEAVEMCFGDEKEKMEKLLKRLKKIKKNNDII